MTGRLGPGQNGRRARRAALLLLLLSSVPFVAHADPAPDSFEAGRAAFAAGRPLEASNNFRRVVADHPDSAFAPQAGYLLGVSLFNAGQWQESISALSTFRSRYSGSGLVGRSSYWLGAASIELGRYQEALGFLADFQAMGTPPALFAASTGLLIGIALEGLGRSDEAAARYREVLDGGGGSGLTAEARFRLA